MKFMNYFRVAGSWLFSDIVRVYDSFHKLLRIYSQSSVIVIP